MGGLHAKSMTSQRYRATYKMADMRYCGNVITTTRWRLYVILHLQQYSRRLNLFFITDFRFYKASFTSPRVVTSGSCSGVASFLGARGEQSQWLPLRDIIHLKNHNYLLHFLVFRLIIYNF